MRVRKTLLDDACDLSIKAGASGCLRGFSHPFADAELKPEWQQRVAASSMQRSDAVPTSLRIGPRCSKTLSARAHARS